MTVADAFGRLRLSTLVAVVGFAVVAVGSIGPWGTVGALSVSGTKGDGVITLVCAAVGVLALALGRGRTVAAIIAGVAAVVALVTAGYDTVHIAYEASQITPFGVQLVHAGWGVYVVVIGAAIACGALAMRLSAALLRNAAIVLAVRPVGLALQQNHSRAVGSGPVSRNHSRAVGRGPCSRTTPGP